MTDYIVAYAHPHRPVVACFEILCDPQPDWRRREPYRGSDVVAVLLRAGEADVISLSDIRTMHEAAPDKTLPEIVDGWRWHRELYGKARP